MSSTPIVNNSLVTAAAAAPAPLPIPGVPLYGSTATTCSLNANEPLYYSPAQPGIPCTTGTTTTTNLMEDGAVPTTRNGVPVSINPAVAPPSTFHDRVIESARSSALKLGVVLIILGASLFGVMMWTYQSARVSGQMTLVLGIILIAHSCSKTAPLMRNKAYGGCCAQLCPWKILRVLCTMTTIINICSAVAMTVLAVLSFTIWSSKDEILATQICCTVGAVLSSVAGLLSWKACSPCTSINERLAALVADGTLVVSFEYMWCAHPYLAPVVVSTTNNNTSSSEGQMISVVTTGSTIVGTQQVEASSSSPSAISSSSCWDYNQVEVQPIVPLQDGSGEVSVVGKEEKAAFSA